MVCIGEKKTNRLRDLYGVLHSSPLKSRWALTKMMSSRIREQGWKTGTFQEEIKPNTVLKPINKDFI